MIQKFAYCVIFMLSLSRSNAQSSPAINGKITFESKCKRCHGTDGTKGMFGAKHLRKSRRDTAELFKIISDGKKIMPSWKRKLTTIQIKELIAYIQLLRK